MPTEADLVPIHKNSIQLELFRTFVANDATDLSNTINVWESIPKYFFTPAQMKQLRTENGLAEPYTWAYVYNGMNFEVTIQPATLPEGGGYRAWFPSAAEELIEEVLKKIFSIDGQGHHDPREAESWVTFTVRQLWRELRARGRERNLDQIKRSLEIMNRCHLSVRKEGREIYSGPVLGELVNVDRQAYLENTDARWAAPLPRLLQDFLMASLERRYAGVALGPEPARYRLVTVVRDFQAEYPAGSEGPPRVRVRLTAVLWDRKREEAVMRERVALTTRAEANRLGAVVGALEGVMRKAADRILTGMDRHLTAQ